MQLYVLRLLFIATIKLCSTSSPDRECNETDIRLVRGKTPDDGRVEICLD